MTVGRTLASYVDDTAAPESIAKIDEDDTTVIAPAVHPAGNLDLLADQ